MYLSIIILSLLTFFAPLQAKSDSAKTQANVKELVKDTSDFSFSVYSSLNPDTSSNVLYSPFSIYKCLTMVYAGARGETASQMQNSLALNINQKKLPQAMLKLSQMLMPQETDSVTYEMSMANALWVDLDTFILSDFRHILENDYDAKLQSLNFAETEQSIFTINNWTSNQTHGKITDLLKSGDVDGSTRLLVTNAIYFKGMWQRPFDPKLTKNAPFFTSADLSTEVKMMETTALFPYFENDDLQILALPIKGNTSGGGQMGCLVFLPKSRTGMPDLEKRLTVPNFENWIAQLKEENINAKIPKFSLKQRLELKDLLQKLGMNLAFTKDADFSGIDGMRDLFLNKVFHETFFSFDEMGITAAAATGASINTTAVLQKKPPIPFVANHPFLFVLVDLNTYTQLFIGKFQNT